MAVVLVKTQNHLTNKTIFMYGIIPLLVLCLFFSFHIAMLNAEASITNDDKVLGEATIIVTTSNFTGEIVVTGNEDVDGSVVIPPGSNGVDALFDVAFTNIPSIIFEIEDTTDIDRYYIENVTTSGFTILIDPVQTTETVFYYKATDYSNDIFTIVENNENNFLVTIKDNGSEILKIATYK